MKFVASITLAVVAGLAAAASPDPAEVYIIRAQPETSSRDAAPQIPRQIARHILLQRIGADYDSLLSDLTDTVSQDQAVSYVRRFGKTAASLFFDTSSSGRPLDEPAQAVVVIEGVAAEHRKLLKDALPEARKQAAFVISDPPSTKANHNLLSIDVSQAGIARSDCKLQAVFNPFQSGCYSDGVFVAGYDLKKVRSPTFRFRFIF